MNCTAALAASVSLSLSVHLRLLRCQGNRISAVHCCSRIAHYIWCVRFYNWLLHFSTPWFMRYEYIDIDWIIHDCSITICIISAGDCLLLNHRSVADTIGALEVGSGSVNGFIGVRASWLLLLPALHWFCPNGNIVPVLTCWHCMAYTTFLVGSGIVDCCLIDRLILSDVRHRFLNTSSCCFYESTVTCVNLILAWCCHSRLLVEIGCCCSGSPSRWLALVWSILSSLPACLLLPRR